MKFNKYDDCVEQWKVDLIVRRAKAYGFQEDEILDIQQELVLKIMGFTYDPKRSNGAQESTVLQVLIDNELKMRRRAQKRRDESTESIRWVTEFTEDPFKCHMAIDIQNALFSMPRFQRQICLALSEGRQTKEIAQMLHVNSRTVQRHIRKIGCHFQSLGLDQWING